MVHHILAQNILTDADRSSIYKIAFQEFSGSYAAGMIGTNNNWPDSIGCGVAV